MTHPRDYLPVLDCIGATLEATCDALMTLQSINLLSSVRENGHVEAHVTEAVLHLRHAIDELRDAHTQGQTGLALGFVLARDSKNSGRSSRSGQSSPRRTA